MRQVPSQQTVMASTVMPVRKCPVSDCFFPTGPPLSHSPSLREGLSAFRRDFASNSASV
jgi:hypothetical protein